MNPYPLILFFLWPFRALIAAINHFELPQNKAIVYMFLALFGFTFVLGNEAMDSFRYADKLQQTALLPFNQFYNILFGMYASETDLDIMMPLVNFIISRFTTDHRVLFGVWALIFGYFYLKSISNLHNIYITYRNINALLFLVLFIILNPITNINGFRMWTAAWIFFLGAYHVVVNEDKKYLFLSCVSILFHFSFISVNLILFLYVIIGNQNRLYYFLIFLSFLIPAVTISYFIPLSGFLGEGIADKLSRYTSDSTLAAFAVRGDSAIDRWAWYLYLPRLTLRYYMIITFFYFQFKYQQFKKNRAMENLFSFSLLFFAFANFVGPFPSMSRFFTLFYLFVSTYLLMLFVNMKANKIHPLIIIGLIPLSLNIIVELRALFDVLNPWIFTLLPMAFINDHISVYELLFK